MARRAAGFIPAGRTPWTANLAMERRGLVYWWQFAFANWGLYLTDPNLPEVQEAPSWRI